MEKILTFTQKVQKGAAEGQLGLFGEETQKSSVAFTLELDEPETQLTSEEKLAWEKELLGIYFSEHPLDSYVDKIKALESAPIVDICVADNNKTVRLSGVITSLHKILTRKNDPMVFARFEDKTGNTELIIFPSVLEKYQHLIEDGKILYVKGKVSNKDGQLKVLVDTLEDLKLKEADKPDESTNFVHVADEATIVVPDTATDTDLVALKNLLATHKGDTETFVIIGTNGSTKKVKMPFGIDFSNGIVGDINALLSRRQ